MSTIEKFGSKLEFHFSIRCLAISRIGGSTLPQNIFYFMNTETFEEVPVDAKIVGDNEDWIEEGMEVSLVFFKGGVIEVVVPSTGVYQIAETEPNVKGNTAQGYTKPATLSSGAVINVPGYLEQGEMIKVDTDKGVFLERAKE